MVWWLSHWLCPCRVESPAQGKVGATATQNQFGSVASASASASASVQSRVESMETICSSNFPLYRYLPLYKVHQIGRAATGNAAGEPTLLE